MLDAGLVSQLSGLGWSVTLPPIIPSSLESLKPLILDPTPTHIKNGEWVSRVTQAVAVDVHSAISQGIIPITLGGDHSIAIGTVAGSASYYTDLGVIWVDAHADINPPAQSLSGNLHGCPVSFVTGLAGSPKHFDWVPSCLPLGRLVYIGLRDVDEAEKLIIRQNKIKAYSMYDVDKYGIGEVMRQALEYLGSNSPIHLSFDVDALDPSVVPATGTPVRGGLTFREGHFICEELWQSGRLIAMDLMEVNPLLGDTVAQQKQTIDIGCSLIRAALGETLL